ncbi:hypothetical protein THEYE_A2016 [Thermodesulfovibrio yellowstonii DSM 11347]|uniref:Uncharacterized protein n=1 Tax=Thermodesulfovibrio yellowstonii (strain ATCC 51303 / DSM 11347 / YP87) TaxID=289376 RepID=B5YIS9_THEYD|nr:hypothetical protein THEYE_A2016 [Thermodesulfovibrio yellowstonii DSM 11347]
MVDAKDYCFISHMVQMKLAIPPAMVVPPLTLYPTWFR